MDCSADTRVRRPACDSSSVAARSSELPGTPAPRPCSRPLVSSSSGRNGRRKPPTSRTRAATPRTPPRTSARRPICPANLDFLGAAGPALDLDTTIRLRVHRGGRRKTGRQIGRRAVPRTPEARRACPPRARRPGELSAEEKAQPGPPMSGQGDATSWARTGTGPRDLRRRLRILTQPSGHDDPAGSRLHGQRVTPPSPARRSDAAACAARPSAAHGSRNNRSFGRRGRPVGSPGSTVAASS